MGVLSTVSSPRFFQKLALWSRANLKCVVYAVYAWVVAIGLEGKVGSCTDCSTMSRYRDKKWDTAVKTQGDEAASRLVVWNKTIAVSVNTSLVCVSRISVLHAGWMSRWWLRKGKGARSFSFRLGSWTGGLLLASNHNCAPSCAWWGSDDGLDMLKG